MRCAAILALIVLIAVALKPSPSQADAESLPVVVEKIDGKSKGMSAETTLSPKDFFLKHLKTTKAQKKHKEATATIAGATTTAGPVKPRAKPTKAGKSKTKASRKNRAHCTQCSTTPVVTHMEKKINDETPKPGNTTEILLDTETVAHTATTAADAIKVVTNVPVNP